MDEKEINNFFGKLMDDEDIRTNFINDPVGTVEGIGYSLTSKQKNGLESMDKTALKNFVEHPEVGCTIDVCGFVF